MEKKTLSLYKKLLIVLGVLAVLSPLGLIASGDAWGEWSKDTIAKMMGYIPHGLAKFSDLWNAPLADYSVKGMNDVVGYIISAVVGSILVMVFMYILGKLLSKGK